MDPLQLKSLTDACFEGEPAAIEEFQRRYGEIIYNYPRKVHGVQREDIGDFYLYVFEKKRIFKRIQAFQGDGISFEDYLKYFVLRHLTLEWLRETRKHEIKTTSFDVCHEPASREENVNSADPLQIFYQDSYLILRIYLMFEIDLPQEDIRRIVGLTGRSYVEVVKLIEKINHSLQLRGMKRKEDVAKFDVLHSRRCEYRRKLLGIEEEIAFARHNKNRILFEKLQEQKDELHRKYHWRSQQIEKLHQKIPDDMVTTSYKDISELLNIPVGTVSSKLHQVKADFRRAYEAAQKGCK